MKHLHLTLGYLREQRGKIDNAISLLEAQLGVGANGNGNGHRNTLRLAADALAIHHEANGARPKHAGGRPKGSGTKSRKLSEDEKRATRQRTAKLLAALDTSTPQPWPGDPRAVSVLVQHGYLKRKGEGYLRTAKEFEA